MNHLILPVSAVTLFACLYWVDDTNYQVIFLIVGGVISIAYLLASLLKTSGRQAPDRTRRKLLAGGAALGTLAYFGDFLRVRLPQKMMPDYIPALEPFDIDLKLGVQSSFSLVDKQPSIADGPFYSLNTPEARFIAAESTAGEPMVFQGRIVNEAGKPLEGAVIEIWHSDGNGDYDNAAFNCRGHQFTNANGCFEFHTVKPRGYGKRSLSIRGILDYRASHFHIKLKYQDRFQTTQVWLPDDPRGADDVAFQALKAVATTNQQVIDGVSYSRFDFVL